MNLTIRSNDGWQEIQFIERKRIKKSNNMFLLFELNLLANNWNKEETLHDLFNDLVIDQTVSYKQICITKTSWDKFLELTIGWINEGILFEHKFYDNLGEYLILSLNESSDKLISSLDKPVLSVSLKNSRSKMDFNMIIDRSSITNQLLIET